MVMRENNFREVNALTLSTELQEREQALVEDEPLLDGGIPVIEDLGEEGV